MCAFEQLDVTNLFVLANTKASCKCRLQAEWSVMDYYVDDRVLISEVPAQVT